MLISEPRQILGLQFFSGNATEAIDRMRQGGLLVVPAAPALSRLPVDHAYREALLNADLTITDSAFMVAIWNLLQRDSLRRLSGLEYFDALIEDAEFRRPGEAFYVMAGRQSAAKNADWLRKKGIELRPEQVYIAPKFGRAVAAPQLLRCLAEQKPKHIVITIGGGIQERLGLYIKRSLDYAPAIHCIGAAIAFRSGDQVYIPGWADRIRMGWLLRCLWRPQRYVPRYWEARKLAWLLLRYRSQLPPMLAPGGAGSAETRETSVAH